MNIKNAEDKPIAIAVSRISEDRSKMTLMQFSVAPRDTLQISMPGPADALIFPNGHSMLIESTGAWIWDDPPPRMT